MKDNQRVKSVSIVSILIIVFVMAMMVSVSGIGYMIFTNWISTEKHTTEHLAEAMNRKIYTLIDTFMQVPEHMNELNHKLIENGILNVTDEIAREKFFVGVLNSYEKEIYSFSYGTVTGEYYGARRNENGIIEIMRNNSNTEGNSWYYSVKDDLTAGELVVQAGKFDPRTRNWYKAAKEAGEPTFSPIYKHFLMDDLVVSAACPVYNDKNELQGVLGTHMLISGIGKYLEDIVSDNKGYAFIVEKTTGELIANSIEKENFNVLNDGTLKRNTLNEINYATISKAYQHYNTVQDTGFLVKGEDVNLYINVEEYHKKGLDWVIISATPESLLITEVNRNIQMTIFFVLIAVLLAATIYYSIMRKLLNPMRNLLKVTESLSSGDLSQRVEIVRNDEIGRISHSFNKVADKIYYLINNLEDTVNARTEELHRTNDILEENKGQLRLILDSTAEAIYGIDLEGNCTFCNESCIRLLGYSDESDLIGENMHWKIHHSHRDKTPFSLEECKIIQAIKQGKGAHVHDEVFWKADGVSFDVEYHSYPQYKANQIVGAVVTFMDNTERRRTEEEIKYISCHDILTGLHNRRCFEDSLIKYDTVDNLPLSFIFADINGLKMTNDIFGHAAGDELIKKSAVILQQFCREKDTVARIGGDEFIILLPNANYEYAQKVISQIKTEFSKATIAAIKCSISLGCDAKTSFDQSVEEIMANAENEMYKDKTINRQNINSDMIHTIIETLHDRSPREKQHSIAVSELCKKIGIALNLEEAENKKLEQVGYLHDIGKIVLEDPILNGDNLTEDELEKLQQHSVIGYRILNLFDDKLDLADGVFSHQERWDGTGYPKGLKGNEIPIMARIIAVAEEFDERTNTYNPNAVDKEVAIQEIKKLEGISFDPVIVEAFLKCI